MLAINDLWTRAHAELGVADATLASLLSCSLEEVVSWRTGAEPTPDAVARHLAVLFGEGGIWHAALGDRARATRVLPAGGLSPWLAALGVVTIFVPVAFLVFSLLRATTFNLSSWLGQGVLLVTAVICVRLALGFSRMMGPKCSLCGEMVRGGDTICSGCQAELI
jgi:hypothetical protein